MKNIKIITFLFVLVNLINCKAQQTFPLNTDYLTVPNNSYLKDLNNELSSFTGIYKGFFEGKEVTLYITKKEYDLEKRTKKTYYTDVLEIKFTIKNPSGIIVQNTQNTNLSINKIRSMGTKPQFNAVIFDYSGTNCNVGWGIISIRKINPTQIYWDYNPNSILLDAASCPGNPDTKVYLPVTKDLIFTKQ